MFLIRAVLCLVLLLARTNIQAANAAPPAQDDDPETRIERLLQALDHLEHALVPLREAGDERAITDTLNAIGTVLSDLGSAYREGGQYQQALIHHQRALLVAQELGNRRSQASNLSNLGQTYYEMKQYQSAAGYFDQALPIWREVDDSKSQARTLSYLGDIYTRLKRYHQAIQYYWVIRQDYSHSGRVVYNGGCSADHLVVKESCDDPSTKRSIAPTQR
jgi:tetratricopeptide (TPR) repeat protein